MIPEPQVIHSPRKLSDRFGRYLLIALAGLLPGLATLVLVSGYFQVEITHFLPVGWSDQTYYWHQILTFQQTGFQGGYYTFNEVPPRIESIHYGLWGFPYPAIYGLIARVVGWETYTGILLNMAVMAVSVWVCLLLARFERRQILFTMLALLAVSPVLMFMPTISQETFHQAAALILGGVFLTVLQGQPPRNRFFPGLILLFFIVISLVRFSWIYLLLPFWLLLGKKQTVRSITLAVIGTAVLTVAILALFQLTTAPANNSIVGRVTGISVAPLERALSLLRITGENLQRMLQIENIFALTPAEVQNFQYLALLAALTLGGLLVITKFRAKAAPLVPLIAWREIVFHIYNLGVMLITALVLYLPEGYYRVFAPHLLLSLVVLIGNRHYRLVGAIVLLGMVSTGAFLKEYQQFRVPPFTIEERATFEAMRTTFQEHLVYDAETNNAWCNTLLLPRELLNTSAIVFVPGGIGVSFYLTPTALHYPLRSQYLLLDSAAYAKLKDQIRVEVLAQTSIGTLYRNLDVDCESESARDR